MPSTRPRASEPADEQPFFAELEAAGRAPSARRWASHVAPLSATWLDLLPYLRRWVRYSKRYACASSGEAHRAQPPPLHAVSPTCCASAQAQLQPRAVAESRVRVAIDSRGRSMSHQQLQGAIDLISIIWACVPGCTSWHRRRRSRSQQQAAALAVPGLWIRWLACCYCCRRRRCC